MIVIIYFTTHFCVFMQLNNLCILQKKLMHKWKNFNLYLCSYFEKNLCIISTLYYNIDVQITVDSCNFQAFGNAGGVSLKCQKLVRNAQASDSNQKTVVSKC